MAVNQKRNIAPSLLRGHPYRPAVQTNVMDTWLRHGWQPPSRRRQAAVRAKLNPLGGKA